MKSFGLGSKMEVWENMLSRKNNIAKEAALLRSKV